MSDPVWEKSAHLEIKGRGPSVVDFVEPGYQLPITALPPGAPPGLGVDLSITITASHTYGEWARAYARQGAADLKVYQELRRVRETGAIDDCHELHYLQMGLEKIARAYLLKTARGDRRPYLLSHAAVDHFASLYVRSPDHKRRFEGRDQLWRQVRLLAGEIEHLTPAVERQARPSNLEYPWSDGMTLTVPKDVRFLSRFSFAPNVWVQLIEILDEVSQALAR